MDAISAIHVGNGALLDNSYRICQEYFGRKVDVISTDVVSNRGRFPVLIEDIFCAYGGGRFGKAWFALKLSLVYCVEVINTKLFSARLRIPWEQRMRACIDAIDRADICVSISGETINDHYSPVMYQRLMMYHLAMIKGKELYIFPQSIGPIFKPLSRFLLRSMLGSCTAVFARDKRSMIEAKELWGACSTSLQFCPDVAVTQDCKRLESSQVHPEKKLIGVTVSEVPNTETFSGEDYLPELQLALKRNFDPDHFQFLVMPSNYLAGGVSRDYRICQGLRDWLEIEGFCAEILPNRVIQADVFQGLQKSLFAFISTRMHVGILASSAGIPTLMLNTQHKILSYMELISQEYMVVQPRELGALDVKIKHLITSNDEIRRLLREENESMREQVKYAMTKQIKA